MCTKFIKKLYRFYSHPKGQPNILEFGCHQVMELAKWIRCLWKSVPASGLSAVTITGVDGEAIQSTNSRNGHVLLHNDVLKYDISYNVNLLTVFNHSHLSSRNTSITLACKLMRFKRNQ